LLKTKTWGLTHGSNVETGRSLNFGGVIGPLDGEVKFVDIHGTIGGGNL
jgi:hypothetical protein